MLILSFINAAAWIIFNTIGDGVPGWEAFIQMWTWIALYVLAAIQMFTAIGRVRSKDSNHAKIPAGALTLGTIAMILLLVFCALDAGISIWNDFVSHVNKNTVWCFNWLFAFTYYTCEFLTYLMMFQVITTVPDSSSNTQTVDYAPQGQAPPMGYQNQGPDQMQQPMYGQQPPQQYQGQPMYQQPQMYQPPPQPDTMGKQVVDNNYAMGQPV